MKYHTKIECDPGVAVNDALTALEGSTITGRDRSHAFICGYLLSALLTNDSYTAVNRRLDQALTEQEVAWHRGRLKELT